MPQILRGVGLMICMVPINNIALGTLPPDRLKNAAGLYNLTRNLGGAVGLALINTVLNDRLDLHLQRLRESVEWGSSTAVETLNNLTQKFHDLGSDASGRGPQDHVEHAAPRSARDGVRRRVPAADLPVRRLHLRAPARSKAPAAIPTGDAGAH